MDAVNELGNSIRGTIVISVRNLVEFILRSGDIDNRRKASSKDAEIMLEGARIHRMIQSRMGDEYHAEVGLRESFPMDGYDIIVEGRADGIIYDDDMSNVVIDEIKSTYKDIERIEKPEEVHLAQAKCYAYIFAAQNNLAEIGVRMTYCNIVDQGITYFHETYTFGEIRKWFMELLDAYKKWSDFEFHWRIERNDSIKRTDFPFEYREGQKELVSQVYRTIYHKKKLFMEAPTGVGKTISTVFPSVKSVGEGHAEKIFYLTAKTITRTVASECFSLLEENGLKYKRVIITAKEKLCPIEKVDCNPAACPYASGHYDRINDAIYDIITNESDFTREIIEKYAEKHNVCPFEMNLDVSLFSDAVICDYNYVFDPNVYLRRFFSDLSGGSYIFLVDEAHNLAERAMKMYSAILYKEQFLEIKNLIKNHDAKLMRALDKCNRILLVMKRETESVKVYEDITEFIMALGRVLARLENFLDEYERFPERDDVLDFYFEVRHFINMYDVMGEDDYVMYTEHEEDGKFMIKLLCVNPSENLKVRLSKGRSTTFFSATLLPIRYYEDMLGANPDDYAVYAHSVFDENKRGLFIAGDVSSKYTRRNDAEYAKCAEYIAAITSRKKGNYMVFFPSHAFLANVCRQYENYYMSPGVEILKQTSNMNENEREEFLARFVDNDLGTLIGFCVMGGIFAEGIDLKNDLLIGAIIVGTGLPMVCNEREIMKKCYDTYGYDGFDYAYRYPGMNKVLQAAGRVIRTQDDIGVVALLDERFLTGSYKRMFPREWSNYSICSVDNIGDMITRFWDNHK